MPGLAQAFMTVRSRRMLGWIPLAFALALASPAGAADEPTLLRVNAFPQAKTLCMPASPRASSSGAASRSRCI